MGVRLQRPEADRHHGTMVGKQLRDVVGRIGGKIAQCSVHKRSERINALSLPGEDESAQMVKHQYYNYRLFTMGLFTTILR